MFFVLISTSVSREWLNTAQEKIKPFHLVSVFYSNEIVIKISCSCSGKNVTFKNLQEASTFLKQNKEIEEKDMEYYFKNTTMILNVPVLSPLNENDKNFFTKVMNACKQNGFNFLYNFNPNSSNWVFNAPGNQSIVGKENINKYINS